MSSGGPDGIGLALQVDDDGNGPVLVPLRRGKERWIKSGASWNDLKITRDGINRTQLELLNALRNTLRPIRPKPLIPILMVMSVDSFSWKSCRSEETIQRKRRTNPGHRRAGFAGRQVRLAGRAGAR